MQYVTFNPGYMRFTIDGRVHDASSLSREVREAMWRGEPVSFTFDAWGMPKGTVLSRIEESTTNERAE